MSRVVLTPPMIEMLGALFGDAIAIDENNGVVELDLRKDGALIVNGSRLFPDGCWGSAGEPEDEPRVPLSEVREALLGEAAAEALAKDRCARAAALGHHGGWDELAPAEREHYREFGRVSAQCLVDAAFTKEEQ